MSTTDMSTGYFGKIPATGDFVAWNLARNFIDRWDRWMSMELRARPDEGELDVRAWRFTVPAGIFCERPCAGVWRMSQDRAGRRYPFVIAGVGVALEFSDPWFDSAALCAAGVVEQFWQQQRLKAKIAELPKASTTAEAGRIAFWNDDWELRELSFNDIHDLAANGLPLMRAARTEREEA